MHSLCASIRSPQRSSPRSTIQASRTFFVSGHAQHGFSFFSSFGFSSSDPTIGALTVFPDMWLLWLFKLKRSLAKTNTNFHFAHTETYVRFWQISSQYSQVCLGRKRGSRKQLLRMLKLPRISIQDGGCCSCFPAAPYNLSFAIWNCHGRRTNSIKLSCGTPLSGDWIKWRSSRTNVKVDKSHSFFPKIPRRRNRQNF